MNYKDYRILLHMARKRLNWYGCQRLDGKEAHDFAIESLMSCNTVNPANLHNRILDSLRRHRGRIRNGKLEGRFFMGPLPEYSLVAAEQPSNPNIEEALTGVNLDERQKFIATKLSEGMTKRAIANILGVTETRVGQICKQIRKAMLESGNWNRSYYDR